VGEVRRFPFGEVISEDRDAIPIESELELIQEMMADLITAVTAAGFNARRSLLVTPNDTSGSQLWSMNESWADFENYPFALAAAELRCLKDAVTTLEREIAYHEVYAR
jgi:hypothetical protein